MATVAVPFPAARPGGYEWFQNEAQFPGPGSAIALHGDMVVHRSAALSAPGERVSMVNGCVAVYTSGDDQHRHKDLH